MTVEQIQAIHDVRKQLNSMRDEQSRALIDWKFKNLSPLTSVCDHTYPWGESAFARDSSSSYQDCRICGRGNYL